MGRAGKSLVHSLYVWAVILTGYGLLVMLLKTEPIDIDLWRQFTALIVLGVLSEWLVVSLPQGSLSLGFAVIFAAFISYGASAAAVISVLSAVIAHSILSKDGSFRTTLFNGAQYAVSAYAAFWVYFYLGGNPAQKISLDNAGLLILFVTVYFLTNHTIVSLYLMPAARQQSWKMWTSTFKWDFITYLVSAPVGVLIALINDKIGMLGAVLLFIPLLTFKYLLRLYIHLETANKELRMLYEIGRNLGSITDLTKLLGFILTEIKKVVNYDAGIIYMWQENDQLLVPKAIKSKYSKKLRNVLYPLGEGIIGYAAGEKKPLLINDTRKEPGLRTLMGINQVLRSLIIIPLVVDGNLAGVIAVGKREPNYFGEREMQILSSIGGQAALAVMNSILNEKLGKTTGN